MELRDTPSCKSKSRSLKKLKVKEDESELYEKQCVRLTKAFLLQGMSLPAEVQVDAPAPAPTDDLDPPSGWDFTSEERTRKDMASHIISDGAMPSRLMLSMTMGGVKL